MDALIHRAAEPALEAGPRGTERENREQAWGAQGPEQLGRERGQDRGFSTERGRLPLSPRLPRAWPAGRRGHGAGSGDPFCALARRSETNRQRGDAC